MSVENHNICKFCDNAKFDKPCPTCTYLAWEGFSIKEHDKQIRADAIDEIVKLMKPCNNCPSYSNECNDTDYFEDCCRTEQSISWEDLRLKAEQLKEQNK